MRRQLRRPNASRALARPLLEVLLDEMYPAFIAEQLRARGHDAVSVHDEPGRGTPDDEEFSHARSHGRAVVTENIRDFRPLAEALLVAGDNHAGVVFATDRRRPRSYPRALITPAAGTGGTYPITFTAQNGVAPNATQSFTLTVAQPPTITSTSSTTFTAGSAGSFTVTATGIPVPTLSESGTLPSGVSFNAATGVLSGTPAAGTGGTYPITFTAQNGATPNATQSFTLTVNQAPTITSTSSTVFTVGTPGSFTVTATGTPAPTLSESGTLPSGVSFNAATGVLSGTPAAGTGGTYPITFTAQNGVDAERYAKLHADGRSASNDH